MAGSLRPEQHLLDGIRVVRDNGVEVLVPPLHHQVVTATLRVGESRGRAAGGPRGARERARAARRALRSDAGRPRRDRRLGAPYFERYVPAQAERHLPLDRARDRGSGRARCACSRTRSAFRATRTRPASRRTTSRSCFAATRSSTSRRAPAALFDELDDVFRVTSIRKGFVGGGLEGGPGLPKQMALAARHRRRRPHPRRRAALPRVHLDPEGGARARRGSRTSRRSATPTSARAATSRTERTCTCRTSSRTWRPGTRSSTSRSASTRPSGRVSTSRGRRRRSPRASSEAQTEEHVRRDYDRHRRIGHCGLDADRPPASTATSSAPTARAIRREPRSRSAPTSTRSTTRSSGPRTRRATRSRRSRPPVSTSSIFNPTSDDFRRTRLAMDGVLPGRPASASRREAAARASTRSSRRRTGRTSSCPRARTARSPCPSSPRSRIATQT